VIILAKILPLRFKLQSFITILTHEVQCEKEAKNN